MNSVISSLPVSVFVLLLAGCSLQIGATHEVENESLDAIIVSFSDGSRGEVEFVSEAGSWKGRVPSTIHVDRGMERLFFLARSDDNRRSASGYVYSEVDSEIRSSEGFSGFERKNAIADRYWSYPSALVIELPPSPTGD